MASFLVAAIRVGGTVLASKAGLLGSALADGGAALAGVLVLLALLRSPTLTRQYPELWACGIKARVAWDFIRDSCDPPPGRAPS